MDNLCLKCGGCLDEKNTEEFTLIVAHNGNIIEQASVYPVEMKGLMDGSDELIISAFQNNIRSKSSVIQWCTDCTVYRERSVLFMAKFITGPSRLHPAEAGGEYNTLYHIITHIRARCYVTSGII
ncbi:hypothetical protein AVEN_97917-1 [Araneus ventricosus]|uniref:Uncharacterized protein n=1 Tax=Araneus ventricosus TaxID=182803 RepID=A0A4Y1ZTR9_ARAVE|nr:hypothetical protein AVEN_97917-1 [Araneus ventricosus]